MTQNLFGQGWGSWSNEENGSWGPRLDGREHWYGSTGLSNGETLTKPFSYAKNAVLRGSEGFATGVQGSYKVSLGTSAVGNPKFNAFKWSNFTSAD
jgi:hypothetical protein